MCILFASGNMTIKIGANTHNSVRNMGLSSFLKEVPLQYSKVPLGVGLPIFQNHCMRTAL